MAPEHTKTGEQAGEYQVAAGALPDQFNSSCVLATSFSRIHFVKKSFASTLPRLSLRGRNHSKMTGENITENRITQQGVQHPLCPMAMCDWSKVARHFSWT